jgi:hypothetical protein
LPLEDRSSARVGHCGPLTDPLWTPFTWGDARHIVKVAPDGAGVPRPIVIVVT